MTKEKKYLKNEQLPNCYLDIIDYDGTHLGRMPKAKAVQMAQDDGFDLICVAPQADPPVCKIADYGKFIYEMAKKDKMKKKNQKNADLKEIRLSAHISDNDLAIKAKMAKKFLEQGDRVKASIRFKGREIIFAEQGEQVLMRFAEQSGASLPENTKPVREGRSISLLL